jgi:hypothetical protein
MRWQGFATGVVVLACGGVAIAQPPQDAMEDKTVLAALSLLGLPRTEWPQIKFGAPDGYVEPEKSLELFGAFRVRRGRELDPVIYLNPNHQFYLEARSGGTDVYPLFRLASVIWHEMQHGKRGSLRGVGAGGTGRVPAARVDPNSRGAPGPRHGLHRIARTGGAGSAAMGRERTVSLGSAIDSELASVGARESPGSGGRTALRRRLEG